MSQKYNILVEEVKKLSVEEELKFLIERYLIDERRAERNGWNSVIFAPFARKLNSLYFKIIFQNILEGKILWDFQNIGFAGYVRTKI